jgi:hypothetical protein
MGNKVEWENQLERSNCRKVEGISEKLKAIVEKVKAISKNGISKKR